jgi:hypothetical protein
MPSHRANRPVRNMMHLAQRFLARYASPAGAVAAAVLVTSPLCCLLSTFSPEVAQAAARLEAMRAGGELGDAASTFETLADLIERLLPLLQNLPIDELRRRSRRPQG